MNHSCFVPWMTGKTYSATRMCDDVESLYLDIVNARCASKIAENSQNDNCIKLSSTIIG